MLGESGLAGLTLVPPDPEVSLGGVVVTSGTVGVVSSVVLVAFPEGTVISKSVVVWPFSSSEPQPAAIERQGRSEDEREADRECSRHSRRGQAGAGRSKGSR